MTTVSYVDERCKLGSAQMCVSYRGKMSKLDEKQDALTPHNSQLNRRSAKINIC